MNMMILGLRNLLRNKLRVVLTAILIAVPFFLLLVMQTIGSAIEIQTETLKQEVDTLLQLRARGSLGHVNMVGNDHLLPDEVLKKIAQIDHVVKVEPYLLAMYPTEGTNFAMHVGVNLGDAKRLESHGEAGTPRITAGRDFAPEDQGQDVAIIGEGYAKWAGVTPENVGKATFVLDPKRSNPIIFDLNQPQRELTIIGMYASGYVFGDLQLFMPLETFRTIYGVDQGISWLFVRVDSVDNVASVEQQIRDMVGDVADIIAPKSAALQAAATTQTLVRLANAGGLLAVALVVIVIFFVMLILVRERSREIGTLKAIGAADSGVAVQFLTEAVALTALGGLLGLLLFSLLGQAITGHVFSLTLAPFLPAQYQPLFESLSLSFGVSPSVLGLVLLLSTLAAALGSAYGVWQVIKLSPLEAIRHE